MKGACFHSGKYLCDEDLIEFSPNCPFCGSLKRKVVGHLQSEPDIDLLFCQNCNATSASRIPTNECLETYYLNYYNNNNSGITVDNSRKFANHLFKITNESLSQKEFITILDFGGGIGTISIELAKLYINSGIKKINLIIVDYDQSIVFNDQKNIIINKYSSLSQIPEQKFDIIIASAIVEHIPNIREEIINLLELLDKAGIIYFRTPYIIPILLLLKKIGINIDFTYPGHLHDLGQNFWNNILSTLNLENEYVILSSKPSIAETSFSKHFTRTLLAYILKTPWWLLKDRWNYVGGWEILIKKVDVS